LSDALCGAGTHSCAVGSVKSNVGHLEAAAGITGLIKTVLALEHRQIPPTLHVQQPSPRVDLTHSPLRIITELCAWQAADTPRRAGVSSFGVGGTNAHVVLEEAPPSAAGCRTPAPSPSTVLLPVSARDPVALTALARAFAERLERATQAEFVDLVYSAGARRAHHIYRYAVVGSSPAELAHELRCRTQLPRSRSTAAYGKLRVVFVFPDLEALGPAACAELDEPSFQEALAATERAGGERAFGVALGIAALWRSWGVEPDSIVGFGAGQLAAAHCSGLMSLADAVEMLRARKVAGSRWPETRATGARTVPCWSPLHQRWLQASDLEPEYWRRALTDPQDIRTTSLKLMHKGGRLFIEISPHSVLLERIRQASADARVKAHSVGSTLLDGRERRGMLEALGEVYEAGYSVQWRRVAAAGSCIRLPRYPWQRQRYWLDSQRVVPAAQEAPPEHLV
jgi:acyl transferase domain-containing protein